MSRRAKGFGLALALGLGLAGTGAGAQQPTRAVVPAEAASPLLPPGHWARAALTRLEALGLLRAGFDAGAGSITRAEAASLLAEAGQVAAARGGPRLDRLVEGYRARFAEEFARDSVRSAGLHVLPGDVSGGYGAYGGQLLTGYDRDTLHVPPALEAARRSMYGTADLALALGRRAVLVASGQAQDEEPGLEAGYALVPVGPARLWLGRRPLGFGEAIGGGSVLNAGAPFDGAGVFTRTLRPDGILRLLGPLRLEAFGSRLRRTGGVADPWFAAARLWFQPHPRLSIAGTRAAALGGEGNTRLGWSELPAFLLGGAGGRHGETENQVASLEARWRVPAGALPLVAYGEWAMDDMGLKLLRNSGFVAGLEVAALPGAPAIALGVEHAGFPDHCCGFPPWYRHSALPWIEERVPLGRPLGGAGSEWLFHSRADLLNARLRLDGRLTRRDRLADNLFAPTRLGASTGAALSVEWTGAGVLELYADASLERGGGWRESETSLGVKLRY